MTTGFPSQAHTLLLLRHGHAERDDGSPDRSRHLDERGREESEAAGRFATQWLPELALVSETVRTRETFDHFCRGLGQPVEVQYLEELYRADDGRLQHVLATVPPDDVSSVLLVGHDPVISDLSKQLLAAGETTVDAGRLTADGMRTGMVAVFTWTGGWDPAKAQDIRLEALFRSGDSQS
jgi:phosphohistidine phosphatase